MTRDALLAWAEDGASAAMKEGNGPDGLFYLGVRDAVLGDFEEADCGWPGSIWESSYCEGGREALQRMEEPEPATRRQHGTTAGG